MKQKNTGKKYNDDFKKTIVDLYHAGSSAKELSSEYGVSEVTMYKWMVLFSICFRPAFQENRGAFFFSFHDHGFSY